MIFYDPNVAYGLFIFWKHAGSVCFCNRVLPQSLVGGILAAVVCQIINWGSFDRQKMIDYLDISVFFSSVSTGMAFLIVTRIMLAYSRFWQARGEMVGILHFLLDTATHMMVFVRLNGDEYDDYKLSWKCHMTNLFNAYFSFVVASLRREDQELTLKQIVDKYDLCLTDGEFGDLEMVHCRFHYIESVIVDKWVTMNCMGLVAIPSPLQSQTIRLISEFSDSVQGALMIFGTPFPFPLTQTQGMLQHLFLLCLPLLMGLYIESIFFAGIIVFCSVNMVFGLSRISEEMEDPFGVDPNDLPLCHYLGIFRETLEHTVLMRTPAHNSNGSLLRQLRAIQEDRPAYKNAKGDLRRLSLLCQWSSAALEDSPNLKTPAFDPGKIFEPQLPSWPHTLGLSKSLSSLARSTSLAEMASAEVTQSDTDGLLAKKGNTLTGQGIHVAEEVIPWKRVLVSKSETQLGGGTDDNLMQARIAAHTRADEAAVDDVLELLLCSVPSAVTFIPEGSNMDCLDSHAISDCDTDATLSRTPSQRFGTIASTLEEVEEVAEEDEEAMVDVELDELLREMVDGAVEETDTEQVLLEGLGEAAPPTEKAVWEAAAHGVSVLRKSLDVTISALSRNACDPASDVVTASGVPAGVAGKHARFGMHMKEDDSRRGSHLESFSTHMPISALRLGIVGVEDLLDTNTSSTSIKNHMLSIDDQDDCPLTPPSNELIAINAGPSGKNVLCHDDMLTTKLDTMEDATEANPMEEAIVVEEASAQTDFLSVPDNIYLEMLDRLPGTLSGHRTVTRQTHIPLI
mmetsp:Transcript_30472/g.58657  ORF Transcript_30472/g.58657 Transcript_30472/m.58657 type:complete len:795 (+) Transcript_30472:290-2674(+)|eukprot:CAMPEP_0114255272 /NCGR_PEP_ID=MMETSP0058-20121206/17460_1 /TAXON_ID=36894 /ORGANISM="Pyramimonas parkeae, CCMP726" /LENGTH=794 /DNA_ID=CAMNT_0001369619 /DNA_START=194 /DNA_END=2578 /DNA_ORIENTATION=-